VQKINQKSKATTATSISYLDLKFCGNFRNLGTGLNFFRSADFHLPSLMNAMARIQRLAVARL
jgi:hypothetical protein